MDRTFLGYERGRGNAGIRNKVLILPVDRHSNQLAWNIEQLVSGVSRLNCPGDFGRHAADRERLFNIMRGYVLNPNVAAVILVCVRRDYNYPETRVDRLLQSGSRLRWAIRLTGRATTTASKVAGSARDSERAIDCIHTGSRKSSTY